MSGVRGQSVPIFVGQALRLPTLLTFSSIHSLPTDSQPVRLAYNIRLSKHELRGQRSGGRRQRTEVRNQRSEVGCQNTQRIS